MLDWVLTHLLASMGILLAMAVAIPAVALGVLIFAVLPARRKELRARLRAAYDE